MRVDGFDADALEAMHRIDEIYTECPFYGHRSMRDELVGLGYQIGKDRRFLLSGCGDGLVQSLCVELAGFK